MGGHMMGYKDDEMVGRWIQYGIFSPIMRLHSSCSEFNSKEPWRYKKEVEVVMSEALRERHRMMPYLYTMNYRAYKQGLPLVCPMYYEYPEQKEAYEKKNQFLFGSELLVAPITSKRIPNINCAMVEVWLPEGTWYDIYTGMMYDGDRVLRMYRDLESIPVFAKAGAILPFTDEISGVEATKNPTSLHLKVYAGDSGEFTMYEDDNETCAYEEGNCVTTKFVYTEAEGQNIFAVESSQGNLSLIPEVRSYVVEMTGYKKDTQVQVFVDGSKKETTISYNETKQAVILEVKDVNVTSELKIVVAVEGRATENAYVERCFEFLKQAEIEYMLKDIVFEKIVKEKRMPVLLAQLGTMNLEEHLYHALVEILTAKA